MTSSDNLTSLDPWMFRSAFPSVSSDPWLYDPIFTPRDFDSSPLITKAPTQHSISTLITPPTATTAELNGEFFTSPAINSTLSNILPNETQTSSATIINYAPSESRPTAMTPPSAAAQSMSVSGSGSEPETAASSKPNQQTGSVVVPTSSANKMKKKIAKRKSRASKKFPTTFITADAANFRQMVQEITGVKFPPFSAGGGSILRPEPQRIHHALLGGSGDGGGRRTGVGYLPTLDTSAFLLNHHQRQQVESMVVVTESMELPVGMSRVEEDVTAAEVGGGDSGGFGFDGYSASCFPTLESCSSWKVK